MTDTPKGRIIVLSGPSGVGKDTLIAILMRLRPGLRKYVAYTTRPPRLGEIDGRDYHFVSSDAFKALTERTTFLDTIQVNSYWYGSPLESFGECITNGEEVILHLAARTALALKRHIPETVVIAVFPPSGSERIERLRKRGMPENQIIERVLDDPTSLDDMLKCDYVVVNYSNEQEQVARRILDFLHITDRQSG